MKFNKLLYLTGNDIPFIGGKSSIYQPRIKEIAYIGEDTFFLGCNFLCFSKDYLQDKDKRNLQNLSNFDILMSIMNNKMKQVQTNVLSIKLVLTLIFPGYNLKVMPNLLLLTKQNQEDGSKIQCIINNDNFEQLKTIINRMFCLDIFKTAQYNPANKRAEILAEKFKKRQELLQKRKGQIDKEAGVNILEQRMTKLALGNAHTYTELKEYTVYQLLKQFKMFEKKYSYEIWLRAKLAGSENLDDISNWLVDDEEASSSNQIPSNRNRIEF